MTDHKPCDPADPCATAYDLASERNTLDGLWAETKDRLDAALAQVARLREALVEVCGCFEAARVEGLDRCLGEEDFYAPGSLVDLVSRRLMVADQAARTALAETADAPAPPPAERTPGHDMDYHTSFERKKRKLGLPIYRECWERNRQPAPPRRLDELLAHAGLGPRESADEDE